MAGNLDIDALKRLIDAKEIDTVLVALVDMQGRLVGKRLTGHFFLDSFAEGTHACDYLLAVDMEMEPVPGFKAASWDKGYGDFTVLPDLATLRRIPWLPGTALVLGDVVDHEGHDVPHAPRSILKRQLARLAQAGYVAKAASELEFYIFEDSYDAARQKGYKGVKTAGWYFEDYHIFQTSKEEALVRAIRNGMDAAGIPVESSKGEWGPGQAEINLVYSEALEMADRHAIYKNGVKEIAHGQGKSVTFMAKWDYGLAGSSSHLHSSLWDAKGRKALFHDANEPHGMSALFRRYLAGQLALAREMTFFLAPGINSYKRFQAGSFAPTKAVWSFDNRTAGFRVLGEGAGMRVECRIPGADVNPYLAFAAVIAAGLYGIEQRLALEAPFAGNAYAAHEIREVPKTLREAVVTLDGSKALRKAFGDEVIDHYVHAAAWEQAEYDRRVTDWELVRYFERA
ncbi:MAG: glutamine synthetase family protein [Alphaproteobacteria bacterium]